MSAIAGILSHHQLSPEMPETLSAMARACNDIAADGHGITCLPTVGMIFSEFSVLAASRRTTQPLSYGSLLIAWDGRLDNRTQLQDLVVGSGAVRPSDAELVGRLYETFGSDAIRRLVGDFAVAIWDGKARQLLLARDAMGGRPLFFSTAGDQLYWASTLSALLASGKVDDEIDEEWLAGYLVRLVPAEGTPYRKIRTLPAGHMLISEPSGHRVIPYWKLGTQEEIRYRRDVDYEDHFRELFFDAVRVRMQTGGAPVCAELSGGLDSSSIVCVADHLLRSGNVEASDLLTYSIVYDRASSSDEREYIEAVEERIGKPGIRLLEDEHSFLAEGFDRPWAEVPSFLQTLRSPHVHAGQRLAAEGARVVLTGIGGDQVMWNDIQAPFFLADLAAGGRLKQLWKELERWRKRDARSEYAQPLPQLVLRGLLLPLIDSMWGRGRHPNPLGDFPYLNQRLSDLHRSVWRSNHPRLPGVRPSQLPLIEDLRFLFQHVGWFYQFERLGFQMSHPFLHRPLLEFCLGLPNDQFLRPEETRSLQRRALRDLLPAKIVERYTKVGPDEAVLRGLRREWSSIEGLIENARTSARGLVNPDLIRRALERATGGFSARSLDLVRWLEVEIWLRGRETSSDWAPSSRS